MGNARSASVQFLNGTKVPIVYVISQTGPLYWGVIPPGERRTVLTGRVWFTIEVGVYDGHNIPSGTSAAIGVVLPTVAAIVGGVVLALPTVLAMMSLAQNRGVCKIGHYANGDWLHVYGGPDGDSWEPLRMLSYEESKEQQHEAQDEDEEEESGIEQQVKQVKKLLDDCLEVDPLCCGVCLESKKDTALPCGHLYCNKCVSSFKTQTCPACRSPFDSHQRIYIDT